MRSLHARRMLRPAAALVASLWAASPAVAQDDDLDDILSGDTDPEDSLREERRAVQDGELDAKAPADRERPTILTLQRKTFMKINRYEAGPHLGFVTNDPFLSVYMAGGSFAYHVTEVFGVEVSATYAPFVVRKPITVQIVEENQVTPDISKIQFLANASAQYSPVYGKVAMGQNGIIMFDLFGTFGTGFVNTNDDLEALQAEGEEFAVATDAQFHPTLNYGGGFRVIFNEGLAVRIEARGMSYVETLESTTLEMKNNMILQASASFFFPGMKQE